MGTVSDDGLHQGRLTLASREAQRRYAVSDGGVRSDRTAVGAGPLA